MSARSPTDVRASSSVRFASVIDAYTVTARNLTTYRRIPQLLVFSTIQPVIFVLLFRYVFGGAVTVPGGGPYVNFLMPGIFAQTVVFGSIATSVGLATDMQTGLMERFRSLPMARSAVLTGRTSADTVRNVFVIALMCIVGVLVGWTVGGTALQLLAALGLILLFGYSMSWIFAFVGLSVGDPETAQAAAFPVMAPLVFASNAFVPVATMPSWLQGWAEHQPVSAVITAVRGLTLGHVDASDVWVALAWCVGIVAVAAPLAVMRFRKAA